MKRSYPNPNVQPSVSTVSASPLRSNVQSEMNTNVTKQNQALINISCPVCSVIFRESADLYDHLRNEHQEVCAKIKQPKGRTGKTIKPQLNFLLPLKTTASVQVAAVQAIVCNKAARSVASNDSACNPGNKRKR
jgi:uncharacterized C2H2 Zn-finger protein